MCTKLKEQFTCLYLRNSKFLHLMFYRITLWIREVFYRILDYQNSGKLQHYFWIHTSPRATLSIPQILPHTQYAQWLADLLPHIYQTVNLLIRGLSLIIYTPCIKHQGVHLLGRLLRCGWFTKQVKIYQAAKCIMQLFHACRCCCLIVLWDYFFLCRLQPLGRAKLWTV